MKTKNPFLVLLITSAILTSCKTVDISVKNIQVAQAIQDSGQNVPLIAGKSTLVRVTVETAGETVNDVTGILEITAPDGTIQQIFPLQDLKARPTPNSNNENHTLNFEIMPPASNNLITTGLVNFKVDLTKHRDEDNVGNNSGTKSLDIMEAPINPTIYYIPVDYVLGGNGSPDNNLIKPGIGDAFIRGALPITDGNPNLYQKLPFPNVLDFSYDTNSSQKLDTDVERNALLNLLATTRQNYVSNNMGATNNSFLYGFTKGPLDKNGWSTHCGQVGFGNTELTRYQKTIVHELGHMLGEKPHSNRLIGSFIGWDVGGRLMNNPSGNNVTKKIKNSNSFDIMSGDELSKVSWIDTTRYLHFYRALNERGLSLLLNEGEGLAQRVVVLQGTLNAKGTRVLNLKAARYPWRSQPTLPDTKGAFQAIILTDRGEVFKQIFDARVGHPIENGAANHGFFEIMVGVPPNQEIESVQIIDNRTGAILQTLQRGANPSISLTSPQPESTLSSETRVSWEVSDPDTSIDQLEFNISYSPDAGRNWMPIRSGVRGTDFIFDASQLPRTIEPNTGMIRVFANDGINTVFSMVRALTVK